MNALGITDFSLFCLAVFLLNLTPGPDTAYIIGRSVAQGRAAGVVSALGISFGCCFHTLASAFGLSALLAASATAFLAIKLAGGLYLIYLGIRLVWQKETAGNTSVPRPAPLSLPAVFWQATLTNVTNPKVILFFLSFFPQFVARDAPRQALAFLVLGMAFITLSTLWNSFTALVAGTLAARAGRRPQFKRWAERIVGSAFVALGIRLALSKS
ncbi:LysE family translocator [Herbaspirillum chlorophenolicum]|uniref:LysE family translocator n=1 Tax=Herbaspirillum chlorophenolicum TaxID=211589 RepID=UPI00067CE6DB|nr:LysE family translocator [Herbaspirillum chlorophenolicum]